MHGVPICVICRNRTPHRPSVCEPCRRWLAFDLGTLVAVWQELSAEPGRANTQRISGSRERPLGVHLAALDHMLPVTHTEAIVDDHGDQVGAIPVAVVLASWVRDWLETMHNPNDQPHFTVPDMAAWLAHFSEWACDHHPAIGDFATEIRTTLATCRAAIGELPLRPQLCDGIACQRCDNRALYRAEGRVTCAVCGKIYEQTEYDEWVRQLAGQTRQLAT